MDSEEKIKIQRYLDGDLDEDTRMEFEKQLNSDPNLFKELESYQSLIAGIRFNARQEKWNMILKLEEEATDLSSLGLVKKNHWLLAAASISILLVVAALYFIFNSGGDKMQDLYAENFSPYPALVHAPVRGEESPTSTEEQAFAAYSNEEYEDAIEFFQTILKEKEDPLVRFYMGNAFLAGGKYGEAITSFENVLQTNTILIDQAKWYLGLSYLGEGNREKALTILKELSAGSSTYRNKAQTIIYQL